MKTLKIALIGFGGIARAHYSGYRLLLKENAPISLVAVCDCNPAQFERFLKINTETEQVKLDPSIHTYTDVDTLLANEEFDMADICLPSYLHKEFSVKLLRAGKHVLCEKPMALSSAECEEMLAASRESGKRLMIAQCLRFCPSYLYLKKAIDENLYGRLKRIEMNRLSAHPLWGFEHWFEDTARSGGCILDMHIHDVDMARFLFGDPQAVSTVAYDGITRWQMENTRMFYPNLTAVINGSWDETRGTPFVANFCAVFEKATLTNTPDDNVSVHPEGGEPYVIEPEGIDMYAAEIEYFTKTIMEDLPNDVNPPESATETVRVIEALRKSAAQGGEKISYTPYH
ncbi:MAG: Gfo/Idh/MocA family oxidoreductase [Ruminococcaceae bacterium]|nr:Gfo/Idh/MocA family oxidoreductase [Oscillospiraceae bacterium]